MGEEFHGGNDDVKTGEKDGKNTPEELQHQEKQVNGYIIEKMVKLSTNDETACGNMLLLLGMGDKRDGYNAAQKMTISAQAEASKNSKEKRNDSNRYLISLTLSVIDQYWNGELITLDSLHNGQHQELRKHLIEVLKIGTKLTPEQASGAVYNFLLGHFAYKCIRCRLFHGGRPVLLYAKNTGGYVAAFRMLNGMLEDIMERVLYPAFCYVDDTNEKGIMKKDSAVHRLALLHGGDEACANDIYEEFFGECAQSYIGPHKKAQEKKKKEK